jgi:general secretion pathway protein F
VITDTVTAPRTGAAFRVRAATADGRRLERDYVADSPERARDAARRDGLWPLSIAPLSDAARVHVRLPLRELALGFRVLATILDAGIPASRVMRVGAPSLSEMWQPICDQVARHLDNGETFAGSLSLSGVSLPRDLRGIVAAGEAGGDLAGALRRAADMAERTVALRGAVVSALAYPALLAVAGVLVIGVLVSVVIPRFVDVLSNLGQELPGSTRLVLSAAEIVRVAAVPAVVVLAAAAAGAGAWARSAEGAARIAATLLAVPLLGDIRHALASARATDALASLLDSGMQLPQALSLSAVASGDAVVEQRLLQARDAITQGASIASALRSTEALTPTSTRLIGAGEAGGALSALLRHASRLESDGALTRLQRLTRVVEPALIMLLGAVVAFVAIALLQAVYSVRVDRI